MFSSKDTISSEAGELKGQEEKASGCGDRDWLVSDIRVLGYWFSSFLRHGCTLHCAYKGDETYLNSVIYYTDIH